jgi:PAS domain S-box-containing protein
MRRDVQDKHITPGRDAENALRENEQRLRQFISASSNVIYQMSADWSRMESLNGKEWLADTPEPIAGWMDKYLLPDDQQHILATITAVIKNRSIFDLEHRVKLADGSVGWIHSRAIPLFNARGEITEWFGTGIDITGRKNREQSAALLDEISKDLVTLSTPDEIMQVVGSRLGHFLQVSTCVFQDVNEERKEVTVHFTWSREGLPDLKNTYKIGDYVTEEFAVSNQAGEAFIVNDVNTDGRTDAAAFGRLMIGSFVTVPFHWKGKWAGYISVTDVQPRVWRDAEIHLLREVANRLFFRIEKARAEEALRASEGHLQLSIKGAHLFTWEVNLATEETKYSANASEVLGFEIAISSKENFENICPDDSAFVLAALEKAVRGEAPMDVEHRIIHPVTKQTIWVRAQGQLARRSDGRAVLIGTTQNITKRKLVEEALRESEEKYRRENALLQATLQSMNDAVYIGDASGITLANQAALDQLGYSTYEELKKNIGVLAREIETRDAATGEVIPAEGQAFARALQGRQVVQNVQVREIKTGTEHIVRSAASPVIVDGKIVAAVAINTDITEQWQLAATQRENELRQSFLLQLSDVIRSLRDGPQIQRAAMKLLAEHLDVMRAGFYEVHADQNTVELAEFFESGAIPLSGKMRLFDVSPDLANDYRLGQAFRINDTATDKHREAYQAIGVQASLAVPFVKNGVLVAVIGVHSRTPRNWTDAEVHMLEEVSERTWPAVERAKAEQALRKSESQLKQLVKLRDEFIGVASHELKTPVTSMKAYAQIVKRRLEEIGELEDSELLARLNSQVDRLTALINNLLDTTRISEGQLLLSFEKLDINQLLSERIEEIRRTTDHHFEVNLQPLPGVAADRERIGQVITNLLSNAIKYSPRATTISVRSGSDASTVSITVRDQGYGIPKDDLPKLFERFFRVTANKTHAIPGMGLGLYISAQIIERHGGSMSVESKLGEGSAFTFTLPLKVNTAQ